MIVIGTYTIGDGLVIRWYASEKAAMYGREIISASRSGVAVEIRLTSRELFDVALEVHRKLAAADGRRHNKADFADILTHDRLLGGELTTYVAPEEDD